jgi:hypothetical protein
VDVFVRPGVVAIDRVADGLLKLCVRVWTRGLIRERRRVIQNLAIREARGLGVGGHGALVFVMRGSGRGK